MKLTFYRFLCFTAMLLSLAACSPAAPAAVVVPTQDPAVVVQQVVGTVYAQMTEDARRNPSATPLPSATMLPTATPLPTSTPLPTATPEPSATPTPAATNTPEQTATFTTAPLAAQALYTTTYPGNKRKYLPNEGFGLALGFQNVGSVTWEPGYYVKIVGFQGEVTVQQELATNQTVKPGGKIEFDLWAFGSETITTHVWYFQLFTPQGNPVPGGYISFTYDSITN